MHTRQRLGTSERRTCRVVGLARSTLQYRPTSKGDDDLRQVIPQGGRRSGLVRQGGVGGVISQVQEERIDQLVG